MLIYKKLRRLFTLDVRIQILIGVVGVLLVYSAAVFFERDPRFGIVLGTICLVLGVQWILWSAGFRSELLGTATDVDVTQLIFDRRVQQLDVLVEDAEVVSPYSPGRGEALSAPPPSTIPDDSQMLPVLLGVSLDLEQSVLSIYEGLTKGEVRILPRRALQELVQKNIIAATVAYAIEEFWSMRNQIVHSRQVLSDQQVWAIIDSGHKLQALLAYDSRGGRYYEES